MSVPPTTGSAPGQLPETGGYAGLTGFQALTNHFAELDNLVRRVMASKAHAALVKVVAVHGGGTGGPPTVDVQPLVNQVDGLGNQTPHGVVNGLPVARIQAGAAALIVDPVVGDIGLAIICDRDISAVKATGEQSAPGSFRKNSWSDGCYLGSFLGGAASTIVQIGADGINIISAAPINVHSTAGTTIDNKNFLMHTHTGVSTGGGNSGPVT